MGQRGRPVGWRSKGPCKKCGNPPGEEGGEWSYNSMTGYRKCLPCRRLYLRRRRIEQAQASTYYRKYAAFRAQQEAEWAAIQEKRQNAVEGE